MIDVPFHKSEKMFRRYEPHIQAFLSHWPEPSSFDPAPLATITFQCRFRDSVASVLEYNWPTCIDTAYLREVWPKVGLFIKAGLVVVGTRASRGSAAILSPVGAEVSRRDHDEVAFTIDGQNIDAQKQAVAAALLLQAKLLTKPVKIKNLPRDFMTQLTTQFDVGISELPDGFIML